MSIYTTGSVHFSGLGSELDVDSLITDLYAVESRQAEQLLQWKSDWETRLEAFQQVRTQLLSLQSVLQSMNTVDTFMVKNANSSDSAVAGVTLDSGASEGVYSLEVNQLATNTIWSIDSGLQAVSDQVNDSGSDGSFTYTYKGETRSINVPSGTTLEGLKNLINNDSQNPGVKVQLIETTDGVVFQFRGMDTGAAATLEIDGSANLNGLSVTRTDTWLANGNQLTSYNAYSDPDAELNTTATAKTLVFSVNGEEYSVKLEAGGSLMDLRDAINARSGESGVNASVVYYTSDGVTQYTLRLEDSNSTGTLQVAGGTLKGYEGMSQATDWHVQRSQNAEIRVDGWPAGGWLERDSNTISGVVDGVTFNLRSEGSSVVTVELDIEAMEANIESFVEGINTLRILLQSLTAVDSEKSVLDPDYAESQYEMQKGSVLTGNYGIQMLSSRLKNLLAAQAIGFTYLMETDTKTTGDLFSSLSQIGITTDANQSSTTYGLLVINEVEGQYGSLTLTEALKKDPAAVAKLFAANNEAVTDSAHFGYNSHIAGITQTGSFEVSYEVDTSGNIVNAYINGKQAVIDQEQRRIGIYNSTEPQNAADGLVLDIYDLTPGGSFNGTLSIRNGKINELLSLMDGSEGLLGESGTLKILENNYQTIIDNIEEKIQKEDQRLERWESSMRNKFSRLEAVLATYNTINENLKTQLAQLSSDSS